MEETDSMGSGLDGDADKTDGAVVEVVGEAG